MLIAGEDNNQEDLKEYHEPPTKEGFLMSSISTSPYINYHNHNEHLAHEFGDKIIQNIVIVKHTNSELLKK